MSVVFVSFLNISIKLLCPAFIISILHTCFYNTVKVFRVFQSIVCCFMLHITDIFHVRQTYGDSGSEYFCGHSSGHIFYHGNQFFMFFGHRAVIPLQIRSQCLIIVSPDSNLFHRIFLQYLNQPTKYLFPGRSVVNFFLGQPRKFPAIGGQLFIVDGTYGRIIGLYHLKIPVCNYQSH